jgi:glycosyltransferase involved in cell wall biosynthesis
MPGVQVHHASFTIAHLLTRLLRAGSEENTLQSCSAQSAAGHRVILVHGRDFDPEVARRAAQFAEVIRLPSLVHPISPKDDIAAVADMRRLFRKLRPDIVHTHQSKAGILGRAAAKLAGVPGIVHGVHILPFANVGKAEALIYTAAEKLCATVSDAFISVSPSVRDAYLERSIGQADRHFVAYSAMDVARFKAAEEPDDWRQLLNVGAGAPRPPTVVMLAAFEPRKRHAEFVQALPAAFANLPDWRVLFAGEGPQMGAVKALGADLGLQDRVRFSGYRDDPERLIALADVCVLSSLREGLPRVLVQYAAAGKAIVCNELPGLEDIVQRGRDAIVTPADDVSETARQTARLLSDPVLRAQYSSAAHAVDVDRWSPERMDRDVQQAYARALAGKSVGSAGLAAAA